MNTTNKELRQKFRQHINDYFAMNISPDGTLIDNLIDAVEHPQSQPFGNNDFCKHHHVEDGKCIYCGSTMECSFVTISKQSDLIDQLLSEVAEQVIGEDEPHSEYCITNDMSHPCDCGVAGNNSLKANQRTKLAALQHKYRSDKDG